MDLSSLSEFKLAMVLCSTAGEGDMPGNATGFWEAVNAPDLDPQCLAGLEFSVRAESRPLLRAPLMHRI